MPPIMTSTDDRFFTAREPACRLMRSRSPKNTDSMTLIWLRSAATEGTVDAFLSCPFNMDLLPLRERAKSRLGERCGSPKFLADVYGQSLAKRNL
jgi:hypothetical protein